jgi:hypothetical protein
MSTLQESIRPSADLRNHYSEILKSRIELLEILGDAQDDVDNGRIAPMIDIFDNLRTILKCWKIT